MFKPLICKDHNGLRLAVVGCMPSETDKYTECIFSGDSAKILRGSYDLDGNLIKGVLSEPDKVSFFMLGNDWLPKPEKCNKGTKVERAYWNQIQQGKNRLFTELKEYKPDRILLLGRIVADAFGLTFDTIKSKKQVGCWSCWEKWEDTWVIATEDIEDLIEANQKFIEFDLAVKRFENPNPIRLFNRQKNVILPKNYNEVVQSLKKYALKKIPTLCEYDIETSGLLPFNRGILCIGFSSDEETSVIITDEVLKDPDVVWAIEQFCKHKNVIPCSHNGIKFDDPWVKFKLGIDIETKYDSLIMHYLTDERKGTHAIDVIAQSRYGIKSWKSAVDEWVSEEFGYRDVPRDILYKYLSMDTCLGWRVAQDLYNDLRAQPELMDLYLHLYVPAAKMFAKMFYKGVEVDLDHLRKLQEDFGEELKQYYNKLVRILVRFKVEEKDIKFTSQRVSKLLYETMGLKKYAEDIVHLFVPDEDNEGDFVVDASDLFSYNKSVGSPILQKVLKKIPKSTPMYKDIVEFVTAYLNYSKLNTLTHSFVDAIIKLSDENSVIHSNFNLQGTETGRLSSSKPSLQQIPEHEKIPTDKGKVPKAELIKYMIKPPEGYKTVHLDFSQAELRALATVCNCKNMLAAFDRGEDIHESTASLILGKPIEQVTKEERSKGKTINFATVYGMGVIKLAESTGMSIPATKQFLADHERVYPEIYAQKRLWEKEVLDFGYVKSPFKNRRRFPGIFTQSQQAAAFRQAGNFPTQNMASHITLRSAITIADLFPDNRVILWAIIHDCIMLFVKEEYVDEYVPQIVQIMENPKDWLKYYHFKGDVKFKVDYEVTDRWGKLDVAV